MVLASVIGGHRREVVLLVNGGGTLESWRERMLWERQKGALGWRGLAHCITTGDGDRVDSSWEHMDILTGPGGSWGLSPSPVVLDLPFTATL